MKSIKLYKNQNTENKLFVNNIDAPSIEVSKNKCFKINKYKININ